MIAIHRKRLLFIAIPKNASTSVVEWVKENEGGDSEIIGHYHYPASLIPEPFFDYSSFCFLRDPIDRFASAYSWLIAGGNGESSEIKFGHELAKIGTISDVAVALLSDHKLAGYTHFIPQYSWIGDDVRVIADHVFPYRKNSQWMSDIVSGMLGVPVRLPQENVTNTHAKLDLTSDAIEALKTFYAKDYELIGWYRWGPLA